MKLIMESWNRYLVEDKGSLAQRKKEFFDQLDAWLEQNPFPPQQEGLDELWQPGKRLKQAMLPLAVTAGLGGSAPAFADAPVSDPAPTHQVAPQQEVDDYDVMLGMLSDYLDSKPLREKGDLMLKLGHLLSALDHASDTGETEALDALEGNSALEQISDSVQKLKNGAAAGTQADIDLLSFWGRTGQRVEIN